MFIAASATKARQAKKISEIADALANVGYVTLDEQAKALGICRSTMWTLIKATHKTSGLSAHLIKRMLAAPQLPPPVREKINGYVCERLAGTFGHSQMQLRKFASRLSSTGIPTAAEVLEKLQHRPTPGRPIAVRSSGDSTHTGQDSPRSRAAPELPGCVSRSPDSGTLIDAVCAGVAASSRSPVSETVSCLKYIVNEATRRRRTPAGTDLQHRRIRRPCCQSIS